MQLILQVWQYIQTTEFLTFVLWSWLPVGLISAALYHDFCCRDVNPFGDPLEKDNFWALFLCGWASFLVVLYSYYYARKKHPPSTLNEVPPIKRKDTADNP